MKCACGKTLGPRNTSGRCAACSRTFYNSDPATIAKRSAGMRKAMAAPEFRAKRSEISKRTAKLPHVIESRRECGYRVGIGNIMSPAARAKAVATRRGKILAWCPADRLEEYRLWTRLFGAVEARRLIEDDTHGTAAHARRHVANQREVQIIKAERQKMQEY